MIGRTSLLNVAFGWLPAAHRAAIVMLSNRERMSMSRLLRGDYIRMLSGGPRPRHLLPEFSDLGARIVFDSRIVVVHHGRARCSVVCGPVWKIWIIRISGLGQSDPTRGELVP